MKYNPKACNTYAMLPEFLARHPLGPEPQGFLACMYELQEMLKEITGMQGVSLTPMAGAQGEFAGVAMIRAYHRARGDAARTDIIVPQAAHGTNPATAAMCGCNVREIPCDKNGDIDLEALKSRGRAEHRRHHAHQSIDPRRVRAQDRRGGAHRARRRRPAVLRRRQPQCDSRQGPPGRHGLRRHPHESAQDLLDAARRRRPGLRRGGRRAAPAAVSAHPARGQERGGATVGSPKSDLPELDRAACRDSWAMRA